jgi:membrane protein DedA with SNARE-associated domain
MSALASLGEIDTLSASWPDRLTDAASASYPVLVAAVLLGAIVPVIPTGAVVSAAAVLAVHQGGPALIEIVLLAAVAAFGGDCVLYAAFRGGRRGLLRLLARDYADHRADRDDHDDPDTVVSEGRRRAADRFEDTRRRLTENGLQVLIVSRLIPGGRIPALVAASAVDYPWSKYLVGGGVAALVWAVTYAALGLLGGSLFANPLIGIAVTVALTLLVSLVSRFVQRFLADRREASARDCPTRPEPAPAEVATRTDEPHGPASPASSAG